MVPFSILAIERSGTHYLSDMINSHPDIYCYSEIFRDDIFENGQSGRKKSS